MRKYTLDGNDINYEERVTSKSFLRFLFGLLIRTKKYLKNQFFVFIARKNGAKIGYNTVIPYKLAKKANSNLIIGNNCSIQTSDFDLRAKITIGNNVIIGRGCEILTCSHDINSPEYIFKRYGIEINDYVWLTTRVFVIPSCRNIGYGAICGAGSVVVSNINSMSVVGGNPAKEIKKREQVHFNLIVESLLGCDLITYYKTYLKKV